MSINLTRSHILLIVLLTSLLFSIPSSKAESLKIPGSRMEVVFEGAFNQQQKQKLLPWIEEMAGAVSSIYGEFPLKRSRIKIVRSYSWREPVPWGEIQRWNESQILLHVNPSFDYQRIREDWTAVHEMSHLLLPYAGSSNSWFSEGLASYYQNVARGNAGLLSEKEAWQKLFLGFRRGERSAQRSPVALSQASRERGGNMRIYWSGAAYFLNVDLALRLASGGKKTLPIVLRQYKNCCLPNHQPTSVRRIIRKLDQLSETTLFNENFQNIIHSNKFPDYRSAFEQLGIKLGWGGVSFEKNKTKTQLRQQILKSAKRT